MRSRAPLYQWPIDGADDDRERRRHRQVDADADGERRNAQPASARRALRRAAIRPTPTSAPMPIIFQSRLPPMTPCASAEISVACGAGSGFCRDDADVGGAGEAVRLRQQVEHRRNHDRAGDDADDERDLLPPAATRRRAGRSSDPAGCRSRSSRRRRRSRSRRARTRRAPAASPASARRRAASIDAQVTMTRMPMPEIGLFDAPIRPAM